MTKLLVVAAALASLAATATAQTTFASITGAVTDASGAAIASARITAANLETNIKTTGQSSDLGNYNLAQLKEGAYEVRATAPGFKEFVAQNVLLAARDIRRVDIVLEVGSVDTRVEVSAGATLIETETARISDTKGARPRTPSTAGRRNPSGSTSPRTARPPTSSTNCPSARAAAGSTAPVAC